jgi:hypothetical protein
MTPPATDPATDPEEDPEEDEDEPGKPATIGDVTRIVGEVVGDAVQGLKDMLKRSPAPTGEDEPKAPAKRKTYRDEEESMEELVSKKVKELIATEKTTGSKNAGPEDKTEDPAPTERVPNQPRGRRVERIMGWS